MILRRTAAVAGGLLTLFHIGLLASQVEQGRMAEPALALRWGIALVVVAMLAALSRNGVALFRGRRAVTIWLLAAVLHGPALAGEWGAHERGGLPEAVTSLAEIAIASVVVGLGLALLTGRAHSSPLQTSTHLPRPAIVLARRRTRRLARLDPRPPPCFT